MWSEDEFESGSDAGDVGEADAPGEDSEARADRKKLDNVFHDLMHECRHSAPGARLSARLRTILERMPPDLRREVVTRKSGGCAPLFICARRGNSELAEYLVHVCDAPLEQRGLYDAPDERTMHKVTPLWCAAVSDRLAVLRVLANAGADLNACSDSGSTPVRSACFMTHENVVRELIDRGADIHKPNHNGGTCLINSVQSARLCGILLGQGAQVDARDLQHKTALHYAAQEHRADTARLLLDHGASPYVVSRSGDDALRTAALKGSTQIVAMLMLRIPYSREQLADAFELLGATQLDEFNDVHSTLANWRRATTIRYSSGEYIDKSSPSPIALRALGGNAREWRTLSELELASGDMDALRLQALLVADRVLGPLHKDTVFRLMYRGALYADSFRYQNCIELWTWALELRIERDTLLYNDTWHTACAMTRLMLDARRGRLEQAGALPRHCDVTKTFRLIAFNLPEARKLLDVRPSFKKQAETFDRALRCITHLIHLLLDTANNESDMAEIVSMVRPLVEEDIRSINTGDTLLHLCVSRLNVIRSTYFSEEVALPPIFPSIPVTKLLLGCGASPSVTNHARSTPLHVAAIPYNYNPDLLLELLRAGAHLDQVNRFGDSALGLISSRSGCVLRPLQYMTLGCFAARALLSVPAIANTVKPGSLPGEVAKFLDLHRDSM